MHLESPKITVPKSNQEIFDFLSNVENFGKIMPENIDKFEANEDSFIFALKGMPEIKLKLKEIVPGEKIVLGSASEKLPFSLTANIVEKEVNSSDVQLLFEGNFNPMMAMMVKSPLQKFINTLISNIGNQ